jgi:raffinose/stachyose/melibiose transport system permease protein
MLRYTRWTFVREVATLLAALLLLSPFYLLVNTSLKPDRDILGQPAVASPTEVTWSNFGHAAAGNSNGNLWEGMLNSVIITGGSLILLVALGSIAAYTIARRPGRAGKLWSITVLIGIIMPFQLGMIPVFIVFRSLGLLGTHMSMILLYTGLLMPLAVFFYAGFARALPQEYEEAAQLDGASPFVTFVRVVFPLLGPATGTVCILGGMIIWNDLFTSLIFLSGSDAVTLPVVIYSFVGASVSQWNVIFAALIISMIPILILYLVAQKKFIQGFSGGIKF